MSLQHVVHFWLHGRIRGVRKAGQVKSEAPACFSCRPATRLWSEMGGLTFARSSPRIELGLGTHLCNLGCKRLLLELGKLYLCAHQTAVSYLGV